MNEACESSTESVDMIFEILADQRRRYTLHCLTKFDTPLALADLAEEVAVRENELSVTELSAEEVKQVYMSLYHAHIPKLEDASVVHYDQDTGRVTLAEQSDKLGQYMEFIEIGYTDR